MSDSLREFINSYTDSLSMQDEIEIVNRQLTHLRKVIGDRNTNERKMRETLVIATYISMLGHDVEFAYLKAVEMCTKPTLLTKKIGYLVTSLLIPPEHDFSVMIVNQLRTDVQAANIMDVCSALICVTKMAREDVIPVMIDLIVKLLVHSNELVRKKAVSAIHRFHQISPESCDDYDKDIMKLLTDKDPSIMGASLDLIYDICKRLPDQHKVLVPMLTDILNQIINGRLGAAHNYHGIPAPWMQIKIIRILSVLGMGDSKTSSQMYNILALILDKPNASEPINAGILCECSRAVTLIYPNTTLLQKAAEIIGYFINCVDNNMIYLGIQGLYDIVKDYPQYTLKHQMKVLDCLDSPDDTLRSKSVDLLVRMCNPQNVQVIVEKVINYLKGCTDEFVRQKTVDQIYDLCEKFTPNPGWFLKTMVVTLELAHSNVKPEIITGIVSLLKEGTGDENTDNQLRNGGVELFVSLLDNLYLPECVVLLQSWVIGEYASTDCSVSLTDICSKLVLQAQRSEKSQTISSIMLTLTKLVSRIKSIPDDVKDFFTNYYQSQDVLLQQQAIEFVQFTHFLPVMSSLFGVGVCCDDIKVKDNIRSLQSYVDQQKAAGAEDYNPPEVAEQEVMFNDGGLKVSAYAEPTVGNFGIEEPKLIEAEFGIAGGDNDNGIQLKVGLKKVRGTFGLPQQQLPPISTPKDQSPLEQEEEEEFEDVEVWVTDDEADLLEDIENEKEKEAQALFLGLPGAPSAKKNKQKKMKKIIKRVPKKKVKTVNLPSGGGGGSDLFVGMNQTAPAESPKSSTKPKVKIIGIKKPVPIVKTKLPSSSAKKSNVPDLFSTNPPAKPTAAKPALKNKQPTPPPPQQQQQDANILGDDLFGTPAPELLAPTAPSTEGSEDIFGSLDFATSSAVPISSSSTAIDDPFSEMNLASATSSSNKPSVIGMGVKKPPPKSSNNDDPFASLGFSPRAPTFDVNQIKIPPTMLGRYNNAAKLPAIPIIQENNEDIAICNQLIYNDKFTAYGLFLFNKSKHDIKNLMVNASQPNGLSLNLTSDPKTLINGKTLKYESVGSGQMVFVSIEFAFQNPSLETILIISIQYNSKSNKQITYIIPPNDLLRAERISSSDFIIQMNQNQCMVKCNCMTTSMKTPHDFGNFLKSKMNFYLVQAENKTAEVFCFAKVAGTPFKCLVIGKVFAGKGVEVCVKSRDPTFSQYVCNQISKLIL